jgi:glycosyltransferase involved in cell wall biosynthesis
MQFQSPNPPIYVNARFALREVTGVERYAHEVTRRLKDRVQAITPGRALPGVRGHIWEQVVLPHKLGERALLWSPANTGPLLVRNQIVTIHDVSVIEHPEWFESRFAAWYARLLPRLASQARMIITNSEYSRQRIVEILQVPPRKIALVPCGVDRVFFSPQPIGVQEKVKAKYNLPEHYILFVGSISPRKNLSRLLEAWQGIARRYPRYGLVIAGSHGPTLREIDAGRDAQQVHWLGYVDNEDMPALYSAARLFAMPSLYEGFGLPVLEAMACGTPVIAARVGALHEVAGNAALFFDPDNPGELAQLITQVLDNPDLQASLLKAGLERSSSYPWEETAEGIWRVLESAGEYAG